MGYLNFSLLLSFFFLSCTGVAQNDKFDKTIQREHKITTSSSDALIEFNKAQEVDDLWDAVPAALEGYNKAIYLDPNFAQAYMFRARHIRRSAPELKDADFKKALEFSSNLPEGEKLWGEAFIAGHSGDKSAAKLAFEKVDAMPGIDIVVQEWRKTFAEYYWGDYDIVIEAASKLTTAEPNATHRWGVLADSYALKKQYANGLVSAEKMISLDPTNPASHDKVAEFQLFTGDVESAEDGFKKAVSLDPKWTAAYVAIAAINIRKGDNENAVQNLNKAISQANDDEKWDLYADLACLYMSMGLKSKAYETSMECNNYQSSWGDSQTMFHEFQTELAIAGKDWKKAIAQAHQAIESPGIWPHHIHYSKAWQAISNIHLGNTVEATRLLSELEAKKNENMNAFRNASFHQALSKQYYEKALEFYTTVDNEYMKSGMLAFFYQKLQEENNIDFLKKICANKNNEYTREVTLEIDSNIMDCN